MPVCKKCNESFSVAAVVKGKLRNLQNRKYCLVCSPFGQHNTKQIEIVKSRKDVECTCVVCNRKYIYNRKKGNSKTRCNTCYVRGHRAKLKIKAVKLKGGKCNRCGYNKSIQALQFHHLVPGEKDFAISGGNYSWERIKKEIDKCELLCANCHIEEHEVYKL